VEGANHESVRYPEHGRSLSVLAENRVETAIRNGSNR
jgi:hypothetical protein